MTMHDYQKENEDFVSGLSGLLGDRGLVANLRKWWSPATRHHAYPVLGRVKALKDERRQLVAALFAVHATSGANPHSSGGNSLGKAALMLAGGNSKSPGFDSMERHFRRLLACTDLDDLQPQLHRLVKRLSSSSVHIDYARLLGDLRRFDKSPEKVKTDWAVGFWQADESETQDQSPS